MQWACETEIKSIKQAFLTNMICDTSFLHGNSTEIIF